MTASDLLHNSPRPPLKGAIFPSLVRVASGKRHIPLPSFSIPMTFFIVDKSALPRFTGIELTEEINLPKKRL